MLNENIISLKAAYRHPFEYISPLLYQSAGNQYLTNDKLFMENEEEFHSQLGEDLPQTSSIPDPQFASRSLVQKTPELPRKESADSRLSKTTRN